MYKQLTVATTIMFLMLGVLWAGAAQDAEKEAYYDDLNAQIDAEKEAYYKALEAEKEAYYDTQKVNTKSQPRNHFKILKDNDIDPAYRVQRPEFVRNLEDKYGVDALGTSLEERKASGYEMPIYHFEPRDDADPAQKVRLPEDVTPPAGSRDCYNWNDAWFYLWFGQADHGSASLFSLDAGTYSLESVSIADYSGTYLGLTEATATVNVDIANADGSTASTIATGTLVTDGSTGTLDFTGTSFELAAASLIKVSVYPATNVGDYTGDGVDDYAPLLLSEDGTAGDGFCGTDSSGVYTAGVYDYDIGVCYSSSGPPANDDCANAEAVNGPYPVEITSSSEGAAVDCEGFLNWNAVWYELELPYASNNVDVFVQADGAISNGGIILMDDCACDDYIGSTGFDWDPAGGWLNVWFDGVSGADNGGTILFPLFVDAPQGFTVTFNVTSPPNPAVFFSEYAEGSSNHKYLEIYNGTGATVSLNDYVILGNYNGNPYSETFTFATDATLASGDVYVLANDAADSSILAHADEVFAYGDPWYITSFNGDDVRALSHLNADGDTIIIDIIGTLEGGDPGSGWAVAGIDNATKDHTLVRKGSVAIGNDGDWASSAGTDADDSEWIVFDQNEWSYVGSHPHCFEPNVLIVNMYDAYGDGWNGNVLTIGDQTFELTSGDFATGEACLPYGDFAVTCDGGSWPEEVSWEILDEAGNLLLAGGAPYEGTLSLDHPYTLTLSTASWASEVSWAITAAGDSGNVIYTGSGYGNNTDYEFGFDLADGDYELHMYDSYGDGWNGTTYSIDDAAGHNISSGGLTSGAYGMDPFALPWTAPLYPYYFTLNTASWASEISWAVTAAGDSGNAIYTGSGYSNDSTYADTFDLADGDYEFHMYDSYGDSWNGATYVILDGSGMTVSAGGLTDYTDYGMNPFSVPFVFPYNLTLTTASYGSEVSWAITAAGDSANAIYSGSGYSNNTEYVIGLELDDGDYEFHMYDSYGDSWNGGTYSIDDAAGNNIVSGGLTDYTNYGMDPFSVPWTPPVTGNSCEDAFSYGVVNGDPQVGATTESGDADWYSFDVDADYDNVSISLCESGFDTKLEVWGACDDAAYLGYNDDFCGLQSQVDFTDVAAGTYHAKVFGYGSSFGDYILTITGWDNPAVPALTATAGMEEIVLDWEPVPTRGMYSPQVDINGTNPSKQEEKQDHYIQYDPSDYPTPRQGGDTIGDATAIDALPFDAAGTTAGYIDDYDEECPYTGSTSPDVVYSYAPTADMSIDISICESAYDTKLYVYENDAGNNIACNDDACNSSDGSPYRSTLDQVSLTAGNIYYIVVDGYGGNSGDYNISVTEAETPPEAPANDDCANAEYVSGPYPIEITSSSAGATVDCEGFLNWNAVWYELELPYASNSVDVFVQADGAISNGGIILMDDCACDDYIASTGFDWDPAGGWLNVWFDGVSGADNGGTILFPLFIDAPQGFTVTFDVTGEYAPSFNVYRDGGDTPIAEGVEGTTYTDGGLTGGVEYCYTVTQMMPDDTESGHSNEACGTPEAAPVALTGTWQMAPEAGALIVGDYDGNIWWANSEEDVVTRACYFDDDYVFSGDGTFNNVLGDETWLEVWQGVEYDQCGTPVYPHDGSNAATWNEGGGTITLNGVGAYLGLPKAYNGGEIGNPEDAPESITYAITMSDNDSTLTAVVDIGFGLWTFKLVLPEVLPDLCPPSDLMAEGGDSEVFLSWNAPGMLGAIPTIERVGMDPPVAQKAHLPKGVTRPDNSRECFNWNDAWYYLWFGNEWGPTSVFPFEPGSYTLESVAISDYSGTYIGLTEATAIVNIGVVDMAGTVETIATGTLMTDGNYGMIEFDGTGFELDTASWIGVSISPQTNVGDINGNGADDFAPFLLSDDGLSPTGWCGWDSAGWMAWDVYDFDIALCASGGGGGGNECGTFSNYNVYSGDELVGQTDIEEFVVEGLENDMEYCFNVTAVYAEGESEASNDACATPMAPSMGVSHDAMADTLMPGESSDHAFSIENTGGLPFSYDVMVLGGADVLVSEDFEGGLIPEDWIMYTNSALGWLVTMDGSSAYWTVPPGDGYYAVSNDDLANDDGSVDYLVMPGQDFTDLGGIELSFDSYYSGTYSQTAHVEVSTDAGYSWTEVALLEPNDAWVNVMVDLSGFAGESSVHIAFHSNDNGFWASGWAIDNVELSGGGGVDWLLLSSNYGELEPGDADEIVVTMTTGELEEGTYDAEIGVYTYFGEHMIAIQMVVDDGVGVTDGGAIPDVFALHQNFPNPFNPLTAISYDVPEFADVKIDIYNLLGQNVRTLVTDEHEPGYYRTIWNGKNDQGALVTTGVYIYRITARSNATGEVAFTKTRKLVLMK